MNKLIIFISMTLIGCAETPPSVPITSTYNAGDFVEYEKTGTATVSGQAFMRQKSGAVVTCAGFVVTLVPDKGIYAEVANVYDSGRNPVKPLYDLKTPAVKLAKCNAQGNFVLSNIPAGKWLLQTEVRWDEVGHIGMGGFLTEKLDIHEGDNITKLLTK